MLRQRRGEDQSKSKESVPQKVQISQSKKSSGKWFLKFAIVFIIILYVIVPFTFYLCPAVRRHAVFLNYVSLSRNKNLSLPSEVGLNCTRHLYVHSEDDIKLGVWHVPPVETVLKCGKNTLPLHKEFEDDRPVFLYLHGNAGTRGGGHRVELYKVLSEKVNAHVVTFDYRGYADSTNVPPSEDGLVQDTYHVYKWMLEKADPSRIYVWGHSLGTGVATGLVEMLSSEKNIPAGVILEAPFTKLVDAVKHHPLSFFHRHMPFFDFFFTNPIGDKQTAFNSISRIGRIKSPILILHAEDDGMVPFYQGKELYERALAERPPGLYPAQFVGFEGKLDYGHKNIYRDPSLPEIIRQFMENVDLMKSKS